MTPARALRDEQELKDLLSGYVNEVGVEEALVIAGNGSKTAGPFATAMQLVETGHFDRLGFRTIYFAAHPEGNGAVPAHVLMEALASKQGYASRTDAKVALVTQFLFDPEVLLSWLRTIYASGIDLPVHVGIAGPTQPATLLKYALLCGVGSSMKVLQKQAGNVRRLLQPYTPDSLLMAIASEATKLPNLAGCHVFPFGGVSATAGWIGQHHRGGGSRHPGV